LRVCSHALPDSHRKGTELQNFISTDVLLGECGGLGKLFYKITRGNVIKKITKITSPPLPKDVRDTKRRPSGAAIGCNLSAK